MRTLILFLASALAMQAHAQPVPAPKIAWGKLSEHTKKASPVPKMALLEDQALMLQIKGTGLYAEGFTTVLNQDFAPVLSKEFSLRTGSIQHEIKDVVVSGGTPYILEQFTRRFNDDQVIIRALPIDMKTGRTQKEIVLANVPYRNFSESETGELTFTWSPDEEQLLIMGMHPRDKKDSLKMTLWCYNKALELAWEKTITRDYNDKKGLPGEFILSNEGVAYILFSEGNYIIGMRKPDLFAASILMFDPDSDRMIEFPVGQENLIRTRLKLFLTNDDMLVCTGFVNRNAYGSEDEFMFYSLDTEIEEPQSAVVSPFEELPSRLAVVDIAQSTSGIIYVLAEQKIYPLQVSRYVEGMRPLENGLQLTGGVMVIGIDQESETIWGHTFPKTQDTAPDEAPSNSCSGLVNGPFFHVFYADLASNLNSKGGEGSRAVIKGGADDLTLVDAVFDEEGYLGSKAIISKDKLGVPVCPSFIQSIDEDRFFIFGWDKKQFRAGIGTFD